GVGEEQGRIPTEQHEARDQFGPGITLDVMITGHSLGVPQDSGMRPPAVPQEFDDGDHDGEPDARDGAKRRDADEAQDAEPELPALYAPDAHKVLHFDEPNR